MLALEVWIIAGLKMGARADDILYSGALAANEQSVLRIESLIGSGCAEA